MAATGWNFLVYAIADDAEQESKVTRRSPTWAVR